MALPNARTAGRGADGRGSEHPARRRDGGGSEPAHGVAGPQRRSPRGRRHPPTGPADDAGPAVHARPDGPLPERRDGRHGRAWWSSPSRTRSSPSSIEAVEDAGSEHGRSVLVASTHGDPARESRVVRGAAAQAASRGCSSCRPPATTPGSPARRRPLVLVDRPAPGLDADLVDIDDHRAAYDAVSHLIAHGHRRHRLRRRHPTIPTSAARLAGYRHALTARAPRSASISSTPTAPRRPQPPLR